MWDVGAALGDDGSATGCATHRPPVELWDGGTRHCGKERTF